MNSVKGQLIQFDTIDKLNLHGFLSKSKNNNKKIIIHVHGMTGDFFRFPLTYELSRKLKNTNYDLFLMNTRGYGLISKIYGKKKILVGTALEKFEDCLIDIESAIKTVTKLGYNEIILSGHSTGCQKVTYYQSVKQNKKVKRIILLSPCDDYNSQKIRKNFLEYFRIAKKMVRERKGQELMPKNITNYSAKRYLSFADPKNVEAQLFNYEGELKQFSKIKNPILITFGEKDYFAKQKAKHCFEKLKKESNSILLKTKLVPKAEHSYTGQEKIAVKAIIDFLKNES